LLKNKSMKTAIITGIAGQDGAFLAELLLKKGYQVYGADRRRADQSYWRLNDLGIRDKIKFIYTDLLESTNINSMIGEIKPDEFYNLAAQSFVKASFDLPVLTSEIDAIGVLRLLEAIRHYSPKTKFYQASTSEMFGKVQEIPQSETTPFYPRSPYGVAKLYAHWMVINYRESYDLFACSGILFNHESEYRGSEFVTQKIIEQAIELNKGKRDRILLGNLDSKRDWGYAKDYVEGMHLMLQNNTPEDFVLATNKTYSIREFIEKVFYQLEKPIRWKGTGIEEKGIDAFGNVIIEISEEFYRPCEVDLLIGDYSKARKILGWSPKKNIDDLIQIMIEKANNRF
jgi:GDPmannose 4,6-dehydratase